jgi:hypothetical protein
LGGGGWMRLEVGWRLVWGAVCVPCVGLVGEHEVQVVRALRLGGGWGPVVGRLVVGRWWLGVGR